MAGMELLELPDVATPSIRYLVTDCPDSALNASKTLLGKILTTLRLSTLAVGWFVVALCRIARGTPEYPLALAVRAVMPNQ
jgi:hypothetical protein